MDTSQVRDLLSHNRNSKNVFFLSFFLNTEYFDDYAEDCDLEGTRSEAMKLLRRFGQKYRMEIRDMNS